MNGNVCVYSFADATGLTKYVEDDGTDYAYAGTWSSSGTYFAAPLTAVSYGVALYMTVRDNVGDNPQRPATRLQPQSWSILSLLYEYQCTGTTPTTADAYAFAGGAYDFAGSAYASAVSGSSIANAAFEIAVAGTNAANQALAALNTGLAGTCSYWVAAVSGGTVTTNLIFVNGILTQAI